MEQEAVSLRPRVGTDALLARARPPADRVDGAVSDGVRASRACSRATTTTPQRSRSCAFSGECPDPSFLWWDTRPNPRRGTLEIRALDAQSSLEDLTALVALAHCLAVHEATAERATPAPGPEALRELSFRAVRDGLASRLAVGHALHPVREARSGSASTPSRAACA